MTRLALACIIVMLGACTGAADGSPGQVAFFSIDADQSGDAVESRADFDHFYRSIVPWLDKHGISHALHATARFTIEAARGAPMTFTEDMLRPGPGTIMVKPNGAYRILHGVYTDVDLMSEIQVFLGIEP